jgi:uroporphyrinogen-III synthase
MARVLVTRPEPGASKTASALRAAGHHPVLRPLMATVDVPWTMPPENFDAVMLTSAAAAHHAGQQADSLCHLPTFCVGDATAQAARAAGFSQAESVGGTVADVMRRAAGLRHILHLAGEDRTPIAVPTGLSVAVRVVYRAQLLALKDPGPLDAVLIYSPRSGKHFAEQWHAQQRDKNLVVVAISAAAAAGAGALWQKVVVADAPDEASMLAALAAAGL